MSVSFKIASRFLKSNKLQTVLIALGIALGVTVQIFLGLLIKNVNSNMIQTTVGNSSQITITNSKSASNTFDDYDAIINNIKAKYPSKVTEVTGVLDNPALISQDKINASVLVRGMDFGNGQNIYNVKKDITEGTLPLNKNEVAIGQGIAKKFNLKVGDSFTLQTSQGPKKVKVSGILNLNVGQLNDTWVVTYLNYAQDMFKESGKVNSIEMKVQDNQIFNANVIASGITKDINNSALKVSNWKEQNASLLGALSGQNSSSLTIQVFIMISVVMSIASVLAISVLQKSKQIGILKAMGIKNSDSAKIFIYQGSILGLIGAIIGGGLGVGLFEIFANFVKTPTGTPVITDILDPTFVIVSMIIAFIAATVAAVFAATKSLRLDPMQIIRDN